MKLNIKSRKGFTLIELLVVIGILAVLAAIAIPSVAGLIDRANVSADKTNSNEMTNAMERFASEYELFCQDIASGTFDKDNMDAAQGRVYNVLGIEDRAGIELVEIDADEPVDDDDIAIYRDTKYPANAKTSQLIVQNYTKTSSSTFEPKQSDMHYWYSPDCGVIVYAEPDAGLTPENIESKLNSQVVSGMDAKGNPLDENTKWIDLTLDAALSGGSSLDMSNVKSNLEENDWATISAVIKAGKAEEAGWGVGDTKTLTISECEWDSATSSYKLTPTTKTATIIGLDHDGENTATFMIVSSGGIGYHVMNTNHTNVGGWEASEMRTWLNDDIYNSMSNKDYIKSVSKMTNNTGYQGTTATSTSDKVFLLSAKEADLTDDIADWDLCPEEYKTVPETEGTTYSWFASNTVVGWFWLRSPYSSNDGDFFIYDYGSVFGNRADRVFTVYPAFVIG